jgi:DsbC/DsbD-like thiol-disulfide interchange protein
MSKKPALIALVAALVVGAPAFAQTRAPAKKPVKKLNCGDSYVVGPKDARTSLSQAQVNEVLKSKVSEVETCWLKLPADQRKKDVAAVLSIEIDDGGEVQTAELAGAPEETQRCVAVAAVAWEFPRTDAKADAATFTYPIALKAK